MITIVIQPIGASAMSKMALPLLSLTAWAPVYGLVFLTRSAGFAFNEVVVTLAGQPGGTPALRRVAWWIGGVTTLVLLLLAVTPAGSLWFGAVSGLSDDAAALASHALAFAALMPGYAVAQNFHQGLLVHLGRTRAITEAVLLYLTVCCLMLLALGRLFPGVPGIRLTLISFTVAGLAQTYWLSRRRRGAQQEAASAAGG